MWFRASNPTGRFVLKQLTAYAPASRTSSTNRHYTRHAPAKIKGADHIGSVEKLRREIEELDQRYSETELAPCTVEDLIVRTEQEVDRLAQRGSIRLDVRIREGSPINLDWPDFAYAEVLARETGQPVADPVKLIVPMLERFIATDRGFAKARRAAS